MRGVSVKRESLRLGAPAGGRPCLRAERTARREGGTSAFRARAAARGEQLWVPPGLQLPNMKEETWMNSGAPASASSGGYDEHRASTPPPDLPSILLDARILWLGMPIVSAVSELIIAQLLYLQYKDPGRDIYMYINSTGTCRADGSVVGFETEATAIYDTMNYVGSDVCTVNCGVAIGQSCVLLAAGAKGKRAMLPHATAMLHQPRVPATGSRQAIEIAIKNREVQSQKRDMLSILSRHTGHSEEKIDKDIMRPFYMQPKDALDYGIIDAVVESKRVEDLIGQVKSSDQWDKEAGLVAK
eukprot:CAMPEP_0197498976 /NCGR_PEP_ID=MMETSP1311-20131121/60791_1 /TAXON_ID=464262 /ORGANISM="Genus nov. species nov., Strain RCC856" /LENGTH=299 /DNA_ID=CAMNT_0043044715 /DNA_START=17 /DNA_END=916 /DNA_ORIENTATION=+